MLHVLNMQIAENSAQDSDYLDQFFKLRYREFVEGAGWKLPQAFDGRERDQFDTHAAIYGLWIEEGKVLGGFRFIPTMEPTLLDSVFGHMIKDPLRGPEIYELSRVTVEPSLRGGAKRVSTGLAVGIAELTAALGIEALSYVVDTAILPNAIRSGWIFNPLSQPETTPEGAVIVVGVSPMDSEFRSRLVATTGWPTQALAPMAVERLRATMGQAAPAAAE
jgi:N-acyl-L-homoserine lactone synthetase